MTIAAVVALALLLAYREWLHSREREGWAKDRAIERGEWFRQESELLTRIQHPHILQPAARETPETPHSEPEPDQLAMVGGVYNDEAPE